MLYYHMFSKRIFLSLLAAAVLALSMTKAVHAHPHAYIDLRSGLIFDDQQRVSGLKLFWRFDALYTAFVLNGVGKDENGKFDPVFLESLAKENLANLKEYNYFTDIHAKGIAVPVEDVTRFKTDVENGLLWLEFEIDFQLPMKLSELTYAVYDPTFYIEILHQDKLIDFGGSQYAEENCSFEIEQPQPSEQLLSQVSALDKTQSAGNGIGIYFAEKVKVSCLQ